MTSIEEEIWNIFTYYSMHANPRDPAKLNSVGLYNLCKDTMLLDPTMTERPITKAELYLLFTAEVKKNTRKTQYKIIQMEGKDKLNYEEFLSCLALIAEKCYPSGRSTEESMQQLLMDNLLPMALRRKPVSIKEFITLPEIDSLFHYYEDALLEIYRFFSTINDKRAMTSSIIKTTSSRSKTFDEHSKHIESIDKSNLSSGMSYNDFFKFSIEFGLSNSLKLTNLDIGEIFLAIISLRDFATKIRKIDFQEFWEALVRCALVAYKSYNEITIEDKVKAMFLNIWRHLQNTVKDQTAVYGTVIGGGFSNSKGGLQKGAQILNDKFVALWGKDNHIDYLEKKTVPRFIAAATDPTNERSTNVINTLLGKLSVNNKNPSNKLQNTTNKSKIDNNYTGQSFILDIEEFDDMGDPRIKPLELKRLLQRRPDIAMILYDCIKEEGIN
mmetsp:Transcript_6826/g.6130  ORF Transcript_6826/g.6130 Transcript_6826/m.6130 type:complete len:441 (+) Transcript_6826:27-1349(+)